MDLLVIVSISVVFLLFSWAWARSINLGRALNTTQKGMLLYAFLFVFGESSLMALANHFQWSDPVMFLFIAGWGAVIAVFGVWMYRHKKSKLHSAKK